MGKKIERNAICRKRNKKLTRGEYRYIGTVSLIVTPPNFITRWLDPLYFHLPSYTLRQPFELGVSIGGVRALGEIAMEISLFRSLNASDKSRGSFISTAR